MTTTTTSRFRNPFRTPAASQNNTGSISPSDPPPSFSASNTGTDTSNTGSTIANGDALTNADLTPPASDEPPPPAYTPSADIYQGEATIELGPRRPFQPAPPPLNPPPQVQVTPEPTGFGSPYSAPYQVYQPPQQTPPGPRWQEWSPPPQPQAQQSFIRQDNTGWAGGYPGSVGVQRNNTTTGHNTFSGRFNFDPPPTHPLSRANTTATTASSFSSSAPNQQRLPPRPSLDTTRRPVSEFARDFYSAGPGDGVGIGVGEGENVFVSPPSPGTPTIPGAFPASGSSQSYAPPPQPPPPLSQSQSQYARPSFPPPPTRPSSAPGARPGGFDTMPDGPSGGDGKPTTVPTPGRPLLNHGKTLVYPAGYECKKCHNTGYKNFDPSHACSKCWDKYAKPFSGALLYAPWNSNGSGGPSTSTFQRPLPNFRPPQESLSPYGHSRSVSASASSASSLGNGQRQTRRLSRSHSQNRLASSPASPPAGISPPPGISPPHRVSPPSAPPAPFANANPGFGLGNPQQSQPLIVPPGDPRIGGQLCWRCGGSGTVSFLIFDVESCPVCRGVGRVGVGR